MSAAAKLMRETSATAIATRADAQRITQRRYDYDKTVASTQKWFAEAQQKHADNAVAVVSGLPGREDLPDVRLMEKARVDIEVADTVRQQLDAQKKNAELAVIRDDRAAASAKEAFLHEVALVPALQDFHEAFDSLGWAAIRLMAAHREVYGRSEQATSHDAFFGPAAELIRSLQALNWPNAHRYSVRPGWLPVNRFYADEMPGWTEAHREVHALVSQELAA